MQWQTAKREVRPVLSRALLEILLESALELPLLLGRLERAMAELGRRVDPFELHLLQRLSRRVYEHRLAQRHDALLDARNGTLDHDEVVVDLAVADETTKTGKELAICRILLKNQGIHTE